ncbi:MAG: alpha/beta hydrolase [Pontibacterium sp.]
MTRPILPALFLGATLLAQPIFAEEVKLQHQGLTLNANLQLADDSTLNAGAVLITHGTLAHNAMDIISTLQELLADEGHNSLAINLSLGQSDRHGMYDCAVPHQHKHADAINEIDLWVNWLKNQGSPQVVLMAHSRGGNQTAMYSDQLAVDTIVKGQILIAPQTWTQKETSNDYEKRYQQPLQPLIDKARTLAATDGNQWMESTDFVYCENTKVTADSFLGYYLPDERLDTPTLLKSARLPTLVFYGTEDEVVADLPDKMTTVSNPKVETVAIDGADHFFQDLFADEVVERTLTFMDTL